jgi:hypothetical protein
MVLRAGIAVSALVAMSLSGAGPAHAEVTGPSPAVAVSCSGMVNPSGATSKVTRKSTPVGSRTLSLRSGNISGKQYAWAQISTSNNGDRIWIDISGDRGRNWAQCDLRTLSSSGRNYTNALPTSSNPDVQMRAGYRPSGGTTYLTDWW